ncbi:MAG: LapA family protein [Acidimicrobiales bacterium]|jgi:uncharacterized integral membrane protein
MVDAERKGPVGASAVALVLLVLALLAFILQNTEDVQFNWLMIELTMPLWLALVITAVLGALIANLGGWMLRRRST